jgi:hypothetical protein
LVVDNVNYRSEIHVESEHPQRIRYQSAKSFSVIDTSEFVCRGHRRYDSAESVNQAAFLVDAKQGEERKAVGNRVKQIARLRCLANISRKKAHASRRDFVQYCPRNIIYGRSGNPNKE